VGKGVIKSAGRLGKKQREKGGKKKLVPMKGMV
jgi:hypothetical protein